jgi:hypothetical protein
LNDKKIVEDIAPDSAFKRPSAISGGAHFCFCGAR